MDPSVTDFIAREARFGARNYEPLGVVLSRGEGVFVWDTQGHRYLDCLSAYSAVNQGHCHPKILAAMVEQAGRLTLTSRAFHNDQLALFYEEIAALTGSHKVLPMNSGAEAVESAIKSVRKWGYEVKGVPDGQAEIIVCADNFHGRTLGIIGFSTDPAARDHFGPFAAGFKIIAFGDATALKKAITPNTVAFLVEPIQGEAGVVIPPSGYFTEVRELCAAHDVMLILDEIQTGLGRTGKLLAEQHEGIEADVTLLGQGVVRRLLPSVGRAFEQRGARHSETWSARFDLRRQSAGLCGGSGRAARAGRGRDDRERSRPGHPLSRWPERHPQQHDPGSARTRADAGRRASSGSRRCTSLLSGPADPRHPRQGHTRAHDSHRPAACYLQRSGRLGAATDRRHTEAGFLVTTGWRRRLPSFCWSQYVLRRCDTHVGEMGRQ